MADEPERVVTTIYVKRGGSDETGDGSRERPFQTIARAVEWMKEREQQKDKS